MPRLLTPHTTATPETDMCTTDPAIAAAAQQLAQGGLVGLPTETVYGLAADAGQTAAVQRIFAAKGRPADHPLIVHLPPDWAPGVAHHTGATESAPSAVPDFAWRLMHAFWPGPLTLILPRRPGVAEAAAGGQASIGLRCPAHPMAQAVLQAAQALGVTGVAAPSANRFGRVSPTTAAHVSSEFADLDDDSLLVLDGGACQVGIESTIVDATRGSPVLLRPGMVTVAALEAVCGCTVLDPSVAKLATPAPKASGTLASHYAPNATVRLMDAASLQTALAQLVGAMGTNATGQPVVAVYAHLRPKGVTPLLANEAVNGRIVWHAMPDDAAECAHELFAVLRQFDATGAPLIWVEMPPADAAWDGVRDRLQRAAA